MARMARASARPTGIVVGACCALLLLAACRPPPPAERATSPPARAALPADDETSPATFGCDPAPVREFVGQAASPALRARARADVGADSVRSIAPGEAITDDYRAGRLNLILDAGNRIRHAYCG